ncbi:hypothetical protein G5V59_18510 [Nocardioides sp. W3-2-3]|nr:hypothetical protein [Nocardioides convexus]
MTKIVTSGWKVLGHVPVVKDVKSQFDAVISAGQDVSDFVKTIADVTGTDLPKPAEDAGRRRLRRDLQVR